MLKESLAADFSDSLGDAARYGHYRYDRLAFGREAARALEIDELDPWQERFLASRSKHILLNCCRQSGKTTIASLAALHRAIYKNNALVLIYSPSQDQSMEFFRNCAVVWSMISGGIEQDAERLNRQGMELTNGSRVEARPGSEKTSRGRSPHMLLIDEAARIDDALYDSLRPMLAKTQGELIMLSTPFGQRGAFYEAWVSDAPWERYRITAMDVSHRITPEFIARERLERPRSVVEREYFCSFEAGHEDSIFPPELWDKAKDPTAKALDLSDLAGLGIEGI